MNLLLLLTGISSGFFHSLYSAVSKSVLKNRVSNSFLFLFYINIFVGLVSLPLWIFVKPVVPVPQSWYPLFMAGFTCAVAYLFLYWSLSCGDVSSVMPIMGSKVIFTGILAFFMLGEVHGWPIYVAIVITALSIAMLSYSLPTASRHSASAEL